MPHVSSRISPGFLVHFFFCLAWARRASIAFASSKQSVEHREAAGASNRVALNPQGQPLQSGDDGAFSDSSVDSGCHGPSGSVYSGSDEGHNDEEVDRAAALGSHDV